MKKILILVIKRAVGSYRVERIIKEAEKKKCKVDLLCSSDSIISTDGVYYNNKKVVFNDYDLVYSVGNDDRHQYISILAKSHSNVRIWPDDFSMNNKFLEGVFLNSIGIPTPKTTLLINKKEETIDKAVQAVGGYPCVVKRVNGSEGKYVCLVRSADEVFSFLNNLPHPCIHGKSSIIFQEYIKESKGTDFRVFCIGGEIVGAIKRTACANDFRANISLGGNAEQIDIESEMRKYTEMLIKGNRFLFVGVDFIKSDNGYLVVEISDSADFEGFEKATGINVAGRIVDKFLSAI